MSSGNSALLVMDVQVGIVERFEGATLLERAKEAVEAARAAGLLVVFVRVAFRANGAEISPRNRGFAAIGKAGGFGEDDASTQIPDAIAPRDDEVVLIKRRVSAFAGSDLEVVLRSRGIEHLVLCGIATSGVVLSTTREAADRDYELTVLSDACLDNDEEVHRVLLEKILPRQADVITVADWKASL